VYRFVLRLLTVAAILLCSSCGSGGGVAKLHATAAPTGYNLKGTVIAPVELRSGARCAAGYTNIVNAAVTVRNENNAVIASTTTAIDASVQVQANQLDSRREQLYNQSKPVHDEVTQIQGKYVSSGGSPPAGSADAARLSQLLPEEQRFLAQFEDLSKSIDRNDQSACTATFSAKVPAAQFYQIKIGTHDAPTYSFDELRAKNFSVELSLK
jgi:hypothetical protein